MVVHRYRINLYLLWAVSILHSMGKQSVKATDSLKAHKLSNGHISVPKELRQLLETKDKVYDQYSKEFTTSQGTSQFRLEEICGV